MRRQQLRATVTADDLRHAAYGPAPAALRKQLRAKVLAEAENRPGVYRVLGATGLVLYVGKSARVRTRLLSYFQAARKRRRRDRQARIVRMAHAIEWEYCHDEFAALLRELRLIKQHRPRFNVAMNVDEIPRGWIGITGGAVPGVRVVHRSDDPGAAVLYGPFRRLGTLADAARALAESTGLRDCDIAPKSLGFDARRASARTPGCLRFELGGCLGPCVHAPSADAYASAVREAREFLAGRSRAPLERLRDAMLAAAERWQFEHAGSLKGKVEALDWLAGRLSRFHAGADRLSFVYRVRGHDGGERLYFIRRGTVRADRAASEMNDATLRELTARIYDGPDPTGADIPTHDLDEFYLVASWFRKHPPTAERIAWRPR